MDDDATSSSERRQPGVRKRQRRPQIHVQLMTELCRLKLLHGPDQHNASFVHPRIETTPLLEHPLAKTGHRIVVGDITVHSVEREFCAICTHGSEYIPPEGDEPVSEALPRPDEVPVTTAVRVRGSVIFAA